MTNKANIDFQGSIKHCVKCQISGFCADKCLICPECGETLE